MKTIPSLALVLIVLAPAASLAGSSITVPGAMSIPVGAKYVSRVSVSSTQRELGLIETTCFSGSAAPSDILFPTNPSKHVGSNGSSLSIDVRPRNVGTCTMTFGDGHAEATVHITVTK